MITTKQELVSFIESRDQFGIKPGLERMEYMLQASSHPEKNMKAIHVAGTNGKGSVIQLMQDGLVANGYRVGVFTSPSFIGLKGHFLIDGVPVDDIELMNVMNAIIPAIEKLDEDGDGPTTFEIITVCAFLYFHDKVDIALIETGMGGRFDTTNCFTPLVSVITNIAKDHEQFLGHTYATIAHHKAGIIKAKVPVVTGKLNKEAKKVIQDEARQQSAPLYELGTSFTVKNDVYVWKQEHIEHIHLKPGLKGKHQVNNAALAFAALHLLEPYGYSIDQVITMNAFATTTLPGRFEQVWETPFVVLDSAHNTAGIAAFLETLQATDKHARKHLLFAGFKDKQLQTMINKLHPHFESITLTTFDHKRAASLTDYKMLASELAALFHPDWRKLIDAMLIDPSKENHYYITGSLHFITMVRSYIMEDNR